MEFFKNFFREDDRVVGLCALKKKNSQDINREFEPKFGAIKFVYDPKIKYNFFMV